MPDQVTQRGRGCAFQRARLWQVTGNRRAILTLRSWQTEVMADRGVSWKDREAMEKDK